MKKRLVLLNNFKTIFSKLRIRSKFRFHKIFTKCEVNETQNITECKVNEGQRNFGFTLCLPLFLLERG